MFLGNTTEKELQKVQFHNPISISLVIAVP